MTDRKGALLALEGGKPGLTHLHSLLCDSGYTGEAFAQEVRELLSEHVTVQIAKRDELHTFKVRPKRSIVERSFAWLEKNRRLWDNQVCRRLKNPGRFRVMFRDSTLALAAGPLS